MMCCPGHYQGQSGPASSWDSGMNTLELILAVNSGIQWYAFWIPTVGAGDEA